MTLLYVALSRERDELTCSHTFKLASTAFARLTVSNSAFRLQCGSRTYSAEQELLPQACFATQVVVSCKIFSTCPDSQVSSQHPLNIFVSPWHSTYERPNTYGVFA